MPVAEPPVAAYAPHPLAADEVDFIKGTIERFFGPDAIVRNYSSSSERIDLHVETSRDDVMTTYDCVGVLFTQIDRPLSMDVTGRGTRVRGNAKLAYRCGVII